MHLEQPRAFSVPAACEPVAQRLQAVSITGFNEHQIREVRAAQQKALPPRIIGASQLPPSRFERSKRRIVGRFASFTDMVKDVASNPRVLIGEIAIVVILSGIFEKLEHKARRRFARSGHETGAEILNTLFKEITTLGFVAFVIFLVTHTGTADVLAPMILRTDCIQVHGHNPLSATFETVHMMIFMLLVVLLAQAAAMFYVSEQITDRWGGFERVASYGSSKGSLETKFEEAGYIERVPDAGSPRGTKLVEKKPFTYGKNFISRMLLRTGTLHKVIMWRAIRHEFLFPSPAEEDPGRENRKVIDPSLFSFEQYLRTRLGKVVLSLIHVDRWTWFVSLALMAIPLWINKTYTWIPNEALHCGVAWFIGLLGVIMVVILEHDTFRLTPSLPKQVHKVLQIFSGESVQMLRRTKLPGWADRPGLEGPSEDAKVGLPLALRGKKPLLSSGTSKLFFRMISFFQAVSVTSLILSHMSTPLVGRAETFFYFMAWAEWPFMLFFIIPVIIRRLTIRSSIEAEKDERLIRKVTTSTKECLLRDYGRLVQILGYERRADTTGEPWTQPNSDAWSSKQAIQTVLLGLKKFESMSPIEKREIWDLFAAWDGGNNGIADSREMVEAFKSMGSPDSQKMVDSLLRCVDFDGTQSINWMKFKALFGLATAERPEAELREDLRYSFNFLDKDGNGNLSIFELADGFKGMNVGVGLDDIANLLFLYFGMAKPTITIDEFVGWVIADRISLYYTST